MPLVGPDFHTLAKPPSLDTCTRDIYAAGLSFELDQLLGIAQGVASAARHLHDRGIMHGDLYGHNILHDGTGEALLGDFGAASLFTPETLTALALQRQEVRAFGYLLEELIGRCNVPVQSQTLLERLADVKAACLNDDIAARPLFRHIEGTLSDLAQIHQNAESSVS